MARGTPHELALRFPSRKAAMEFLKAAQAEGFKYEEQDGQGVLNFHTVRLDAQFGGAEGDDYQDHRALLVHLKRCL